MDDMTTSLIKFLNLFSTNYDKKTLTIIC